MDIRVDDKVALITGGSRGIGEAIAREFLASGATGVVITGRKQAGLEQALEEIDGGDRVIAVAGGADDAEHVTRAVQQTIREFGSCDILVNNAATNPVAGNITDIDLGALDKTWSVNQRGPLMFAREVWRQWMREHGGSIVNIASVGGLMPGPLLGAYNVSKAALIFMTRQLAFEMAPLVRVNAVAPGIVKTKFSRLLWEMNEEAAGGLHPLKCLGEVEDVAAAVLFLASDAASWITAVTIPIDGGMTGARPGIG
ncbi:MAG: glucose 1-dehydrogenase [Gammaproteobacteria bacterium]|nr:glucose 1-dehydrogenase [Gammaproteobacteria bacterium]